MPVPTHVGSNTQDAAGALSLTFTVPAATQTDDFIVVFVKQSENTGQQIWDDDGGGGNGYTRAVYNRTTGGRDMETAIFWKFATSNSEPNPTFTWNTSGTSEPMSGIMEVYRGVDQNIPFQGPTYLNAQNDANPPNPSVEIIAADTRVVCFHGATHDDISTVAAPTGFTLRSQVWNGTSDDHRNVFSADIEVDTTGTYNPPDWQHSVLNSTPEYHTYTMALNDIIPIAIEGGTILDGFSYGAQNLTVTGFGFEAAQGTGKVELWSDQVGTIKTVQTIDSWSDTSIQVDTVQGSLPNDQTIYVVVTNDSGDESTPVETNVGLLNYNVLLEGMTDHYWRLNNTYNDTGDGGPVRNMTNGVVGTWSFNTQEISDGNTHSLNYNSVTNRREIADSPNMNITNTLVERTVGTWIQLNEVQSQLACVWKEGGGVQNLAILIGYGNVVLGQLADVAGSRDNVQAWSDFRLDTERPYHIAIRYSNSEDPAEFRLYIDGREQANTDGNPMTINIFDTHSGDVTWNDPDNNLETGATDISYNGLSDAQISDFFTASDNSPGPNGGGLDKISEIRDVLFRRGAIPDDTITSDTEANMQTALNATADSRPNWPLSYRIEGPSVGSDLELELTDKQFDSRITEHLEWRGTGTLTLVRPSSSNFDETKSFSATGGTISVVDLVDLVVTCRDFDTNAVIEGARVRITAASGGPEVVGSVLLEGVTDVNGQLVGTYRYSADQPISGRARKATASPLYKTADIVDSITSNGLSLTVFMNRDE